MASSEGSVGRKRRENPIVTSSFYTRLYLMRQIGAFVSGAGVTFNARSRLSCAPRFDSKRI